MTPDEKRKSLKAGRLYLDMRRFEIIEQDWHQGKNSIDFIAKKQSTIYFVQISHQKDDAEVSILSESNLRAKHSASEAWRDESKYDGKYIEATLELIGSKYIVTGFIED
jgi:Holliday junction resolvase-like predicted endonuclease